MIALDSVLLDCIKTDDAFLSHRDLLDGILAGKSLVAAHTITFFDAGSDPRKILHKSAVVPILVSVKNRGNKISTLISNLERYEINPKMFAQEYVLVLNKKVQD
jgi:hypothetical protein